MRLFQLQIRLCLVAAVVLGLSPSKASAQKTVFDPAIQLLVFQTGDVDLVGSGSSSEVAFGVGLELPVTRTLRKGAFSFLYRPGFEKFEETGSLDNTNHLLDFTLDLKPTRASSFGLGVNFERSIEQGGADSLEEADYFLSQRTSRELAGISLDYSNRLSGRWNWEAAVGHQRAQYAPIEELDPGNVAGAIEDKTAFLSSIGVFRSVSRTTSIGLRYGYRRFDLDLSGEETSQDASLTVRKQLSDRSSFEVWLGAFESSGSAAFGIGGGRDASRDGPRARMVLDYALKSTRLILQGGVEPTAGGSLAGTSTVSFLNLSISRKELGRFGWGGSIRYADRDPSDPNQTALNSLSVSAEAEIRIFWSVRLRLSADYVDQTGESGDLDLSLLSQGGLSLVFHPLASQKISRGEGVKVGSSSRSRL